jgi:hypothetical protein
VTPIGRPQCVKGPGALLDSKLCFHHNVDNTVAQAFKMLGLIHYIASSFSTADILRTLYCTLMRIDVELASVFWNSVTLWCL